MIFWVVSVAAVVLIASLLILALLFHRQGQLAARLRQELGAAYDSVEQLQLSFNRFVPWQLVDQLAEGGRVPDATAREVTVLFADLRGFTHICEGLSPDETIDLLNQYYIAASQAITDNRGHVSKFIGDGILALFGALDDNPWQVNDAAHAALAIIKNVKALRPVQLIRDGEKLQAVVGIHHGTAVAGVAGSGDLLEYTVLGNVVNVAARVEELTRQHDVDILVTEAVKKNLDPEFGLTAKPAVNVKGVSKPLQTFALNGYGDKVTMD